MNKRKLFNTVFNAVMTVLTALPLMVFTQKALLPSLEPWMGVLLQLPYLALYPLGLFLNSKERQNALAAGAVAAVVTAVPVVITAFAVEDSFNAMALIVFSPISAFALFTVPYIVGKNLLKAQVFIAGLVIYVVCAVFGGAYADSYTFVLNTCASAYLVAGLFVFNRESLRNATSPSGGKTRFPAGMRPNNIIILAAFIAIALIIANIERVQHAASVLVTWIITGVLLLINKIGDLLGYAEEVGGEAIGSGNSTGLEGLVPLGAGESPFWVRFWEITSVVLIIALVCVLLLIIYKFIKKLMVRFPELFSRLFGMIKPDAEEFIDETEDLDRDRFGKKSNGRFSGVFERFKRNPTFDDMPSSNAKVRFAYRAALSKSGTVHNTETPNEFSTSLGGSDRFIDAYNRARYSGGSATEDDVRSAKEVSDKFK